MSRRSSFLLVTWDGAGNLAPERSLARALIARGHTVHALAHGSVREALERDGIRCLPLGGVRPYDSKKPKPTDEEMAFVVEHIWYAKAFGRELLAAVDRLQPDLLLVDVCLTYALVAARRSGLPTAVLVHFPYQLALGPFASLFESRLEETNAYATEVGLSPFSSHRALIEASSQVLVHSYRTFDELDAPSPNVAHVGPLRDPDPARASWQRRAPGRPLVLVGLSTSHQNQVQLLQRICDALGALDVEALVTTGPAIDPALLRVSGNVTALPFVSHDDVLSSADLLVTHAGHGTVMAGATYGVPMLCFPMGRDQPMIADRVSRLGLGRVMSAEATASDIDRAVTAVLSDAAMARRATQFAHSLVGHAGLEDAVRLVETLLPVSP